MSREHPIRELFASMTDHAVDLEGATFRVDRESVLARMSEASRRDRRRPFRYVLPAIACAVALAIGVKLWQRDSDSRPALEVVVAEGTAQLRGSVHSTVAATETVRIAASGELETAADSHARVSTADGVQIELRSQTRVDLDELQPGTRQVKLLAGAIRCTVPHRPTPHAFQVVTPDVTVVDLGTVFTVSLEGPEHTTRVWVEEGEVLIRLASGHTMLKAPASWSSASAEGAQAPAVPQTTGGESSTHEPTPASPANVNALPAKGSRFNAGKTPPGATLAQEASLLRQGLAAERQGHFSEAIADLTQLVTKYPSSPMVPDARAALARVEAAAHQ